MRPLVAKHRTALHLLASTNRRGAEVFATELSGQLDRYGWISHLSALRAGAGTTVDAAVLGRGRRDPRTWLALQRAMRPANVVVGHGSSALLAGALSASIARRPFVYRNIGDPRHWGEVPLPDQRVGRPLRSAAAVVSLFDAGRDALIERYRVAPDAITVIPRGVDPDRFAWAGAPERRAARAALGVDADRPWVAYVGALSPEKDPLMALELVAAEPDLGLLVAGDGPLRDEFAAAAGPYGERVRLLGVLADPNAVYRAADAIVLTSQTEGVPGVLIEAAFTGTPAVAAAVGGVPDLFANGLEGASFAPGDREGARFALDQTLRRAPSPDRARLIATYGIEAVARRWNELLTRVVS